MRRPVLVVYDISDDRQRARVRAILGTMADRIQQSGWLTPASAGLTAVHLTTALAVLVEPSDRIRAYAPCPTCARAARWLPAGQPHTLTDQLLWITSA